MKRLYQIISLALAMTAWLACTDTSTSTSGTADAAAGPGQSAVQDDLSQQNVLQIAIGSENHKTLVKAVQAAGLEDVLVNAGPFTVFAPTDEAFSKLPKETLDDLMKPENKDALSNILEYHVYIGVMKTDQMFDGQKLNQVNVKNVEVSKKDGKIMLNGSASIVASVPASNGMIHVIDAVLLPPQ